MARKAAAIVLFIVMVLEGVSACAFERYNTFSGHTYQLDLSGDGQYRLSVIPGEQGITIEGGSVNNHFNNLRELLVEDMDGDGVKEVIAVTESPSKLSYTLIGVYSSRVSMLDSVELEVPSGASVMNTIIREEDVNRNNIPEMVVVVRNSENTISWYRIYEVNSKKWRELVYRPAHDSSLIQLKISNGLLVEKKGVPNHKGDFTGLIKEYYSLSQAGQLKKVDHERIDHFYREVDNIEYIFKKVAYEEEVPVEILKAVAFTESNGKQFDYGEIKVSPDGGIGVMQVTPVQGEISIGYLGRTYSGDDIERLKEDTYFNIKVGAQILKDKWYTAYSEIPSIPAVGNGDPSVLENWYFALWAYNGYSMQNYPSPNWGRAYQERVIEKIPGFNAELFSGKKISEHPVGEDGLPDAAVRYRLQGALKRSPSVLRKPGDLLRVRVEGSALRREPSIYSNNLGVLHGGTVLQVLGKIGETPQGYRWIRVKVLEARDNSIIGKEGVVAALSLDKEYDQIREGDRVEVLQRLNLREEPFVPGNVMVKLQPGDKIKVLEEAGEKDGYKWLKIKIEGCRWQGYKGREGFIAAFGVYGEYRYISPGEVMEVKVPVNVRSTPRLEGERDYNVIARLGEGTPLIVLDGPVVNGRDGHLWYRVKVLGGDKLEGYISGSIIHPFDDYFTDIEGHWAEGDINGIVALGIAEEGADRRFYPDLPVTRRDFCIFIVRALGQQTREYNGYFTDVGEGSRGALEIESAYTAGLIKGDGAGKFLPDSFITREEMAVIINRALRYVGVMSDGPFEGKYGDGELISHWAREGVAAVSALKIMTGREDGKFHPTDNTTRAESAVILKRLLQHI